MIDISVTENLPLPLAQRSPGSPGMFMLDRRDQGKNPGSDNLQPQVHEPTFAQKQIMHTSIEANSQTNPRQCKIDFTTRNGATHQKPS